MLERLERRFGVRSRGSSLRTEAVAGITTYMALAYIVLVNPFGQEIRPSLRSRGTTRIRVDTAVLHELLRLNKATCDRRPIQE